MLGLLVTAAQLVTPASLQDVPWPEYRGPHSTGHVNADLPMQWSESERVVYKTAIDGRAWSTPVVGHGSIWMTNAPAKGTAFRVLQVDVETGTIERDLTLFETDRPDSINKLNSYASPSPVLDDERLYVHFGTYGTAALDVTTGDVVWRRDDIHCDHLEGPGSSLMLWQDLLIFHMDGADEQYVMALDKTSGETVWRTDRSHPLEQFPPDLRKAYSTPVVVDLDSSLQLISPGAHHTFGYDVGTGEELWHAPLSGFSMSARPAVGHGLVYLNTGYMKARITALKLGGKGDLDESSIAWEYTKNVPTMSSHILVDDLLFMVDNNGIATCLAAKTGERHWRERLPGQYCASPLHTDGRLYFFSREGHGMILRASSTFEILAENQLDSGFMASPVVVGDDLILRSETHLYRIQGGTTGER